LEQVILVQNLEGVEVMKYLAEIGQLVVEQIGQQEEVQIDLQRLEVDQIGRKLEVEIDRMLGMGIVLKVEQETVLVEEIDQLERVEIDLLAEEIGLEQMGELSL
jgi:hypothetical protein